MLNHVHLYKELVEGQVEEEVMEEISLLEVWVRISGKILKSILESSSSSYRAGSTDMASLSKLILFK